MIFLVTFRIEVLLMVNLLIEIFRPNITILIKGQDRVLTAIYQSLRFFLISYSNKFSWIISLNMLRIPQVFHFQVWYFQMSRSYFSFAWEDSCNISFCSRCCWPISWSPKGGELVKFLTFADFLFHVNWIVFLFICCSTSNLL